MAGKVKPFTIRRSTVKNEFVQSRPLTLLKRADPDVWLGCDDGTVMTGTVYAGGDFHEEAFRKPLRLRDQSTVRSQGKHYAKTLEPLLLPHGAFARSARDGKGQPITMKAFYHPISGASCVCGWDPSRRKWVVEG